MDKSVPPFAAKLLDFIAKAEVGTTGRSGYDVIYGHRKLAKPITQRTVDEWLSGMPWGGKQSASGRYQFIKSTLAGLKKELGLRGSQVMTPDLQDRLGYHLLRRRGYDKFEKGEIGVTEFAKRLAMEWASLPVLRDTKGAHRQLKRGQSYYAGDGVNRALVKPEAFDALLRTPVAPSPSFPPVVREPDMPTPTPVPPVPAEPPALQFLKSKVFMAALGALVLSIAGAWKLYQPDVPITSQIETLWPPVAAAIAAFYGAWSRFNSSVQPLTATQAGANAIAANQPPIVSQDPPDQPEVPPVVVWDDERIEREGGTVTPPTLETIPISELPRLLDILKAIGVFVPAVGVAAGAASTMGDIMRRLEHERPRPAPPPSYGDAP